MTDTLTAEAPQEARLRRATGARQTLVPAPGPFAVEARNAAGAPRTLGAFGTMLLVFYPVCASILIVLTGVLLAGPAPVA